MKKDQIVVKSAREHNLKGIDLTIPRNKLVSFCGVSGSGKSSLAFDTLYAEGQRRYVQSLSSYARQFLGIAPKPNVDQIEGLSPSIAIDQHGLSHNPRSTVGTVTEIYDYLRLLFAKIGSPRCPECGKVIEHQTPAQVAERIMSLVKESLALDYKARFLILSPIVRDKKGEFAKLFDSLANKGFTSVRIDGHFHSLNEDLLLIKTNRHNIDLVVDKINVVKKIKDEKELLDKITDAIEMAFELSQGLVTLAQIDDKGFDFPSKPRSTTDTLFSRRFTCPDCQISLPPIQPRLFSFNSPIGACPKCHGIGQVIRADRSKLSSWKARQLEAQYFSTESAFLRRELEKIMIKEDCPECNGARLNNQALSVFIDGKNIGEISDLSLTDFSQWLDKTELEAKDVQLKDVVLTIVRELRSRVKFLLAVGVNYLTLSRTATTLSVGEAQRIRLASQLGTGLTGVLYILDEPTVGLHPKNTQQLVETLCSLRDLGNTVVVVEHDELVLKNSDYLVEFGPEAGKKGGRIVATGTLAQLKKASKSLTGKYISGRKKIPISQSEFNELDSKWLTIKGCSHNNLKDISINIPVGALTVVAGVSGSGKSSLIDETLYPALIKSIYGSYYQEPGTFKSIKGFENFTRVLSVDQSPIGRTSRSNPSTYVGVFDDIRDLFAKTKEAKMRGFNKSSFSFNVEGGRCPKCKGQGAICVQMEFLPDVWVTCEECEGKRFKSSVLEVDYKGKSIAEVLDMTIAEASNFFANHFKISKKLDLLKEVGLDYLTLGQKSPTLSGGESQRLKLTRELVKKNTKPTIYLLDEPTTGLHFADLERLIATIRRLTGIGHTVVIIEHNLEIIKQADWLIELGPEGGQGGGQILFEGTPKGIKKSKKSITGQFI